MRRLAGSLVALLALSLPAGLLSGCNANAAPYAARVGGTTISTAALDDALSGIKGDSGYTCLFTSGQPLSGVGSGTYNSTYVRFVLTNLIQAKLIQQLAAAHHLAEPSWVYPVASEQLQQGMAQGLSQNPSCGSVATIWHKLSSGYRAELVHYQVAEDALAAWIEGTTLEPAGLARFASAHPSLSLLDCVSVIEVASKKDASSLRTAIVNGASFATEARKHSIDQTSSASGGAIGCVTPGELVSPINSVVAALKPGAVSAPTPFSTNWLLLVITSQKSQSDAAMVSTLFGAAHTRLGQLEQSGTRTVQVFVDPRYGTWSAKTGQVDAVKSPSSSDMPNPGAVTATTSALSPPSPAG